jgi:hypothetical protein
MNMKSLLVLVDGGYGDSALLGAAREYADGHGYSMTLLRVLPEVTRASRTDRGTLVLPWQAMHVMKSAAKFDLDGLQEQFLSERALPTRRLVRFGDEVDEVAAVVDSMHPRAVMVRSKPSAVLPWRSRDRRLMRRIAVPVLLVDADDRLIFPDKIKVLESVFAGMSRRDLQEIGRNFDEAHIEAGTTVVHEGEPNQAMWIVVDGELELALRGKPLERITAPNLVGVPSMLDRRPAWATVTAITPVRALVASHEQFRALRSDDRIAMRLWAATGERLRNHIVESMRKAG